MGNIGGLGRIGFALRGLDHNSGTPTRRASEEMLQVDTRSSLARRVSVLSLLATAGVMIKALAGDSVPANSPQTAQPLGRVGIVTVLPNLLVGPNRTTIPMK